jgi:8-oxo-dGTP diphosphatase
MHVAVGVVRNDRGEVLLGRRHEGAHQGGLWEFPGGKVEPGETVTEALKREFHEEVGLDVRDFRPLIRVPYSYPDKQVLLDVWIIHEFSGEPHGREGQPVEWVALSDLPQREFPAANRPIITALGLPSLYLITPPACDDLPEFVRRLEAALRTGIRLVQFRTEFPDGRTVRAACEAAALCRHFDARLLVNADIGLACEIGAAGVHLKARQLAELDRKALPDSLLIGASCHNAVELTLAERLGADFAVLSPVMATESHPEADPLGWAGFHALVDHTALPVYALGGLGRDSLVDAIQQGAQGIAAIRGLWGF